MKFMNKPEEGYYKRRLVKDGPWVAVRIWYGPPRSPHTGEILDRSWRWQATLDGHEADPFEQWLSCAGRPISQDEYDRLMFKNDDVAKSKPVDLNKVNPIF